MSNEPGSTSDNHSARANEPSWLDRISQAGSFSGYLDKWRRRIRTHPETGLPLAPLRSETADELSIERLAFRAGKGLRIALALFSPITAALFLVSFLWNPYGIVRSCSIAGLIGFGTNWIAIKMLFRPRQMRPVFGQGLIPSQRTEIIRKVADEVVEKLINEEIIRREVDESRLISRLTEETAREVRRVMENPEFVRDTKGLILNYASKIARSETFREELQKEVEVRVERIAGRSFSRWVGGGFTRLARGPIVRAIDAELEDLPHTLDRLVGEIDGALDHVPKYLTEKQSTIEAFLTRVMMSLVREMDVHKIVVKQLSTVTSDELEVGFREFADDKLSYITLLGGILGLVGGFVIIWPVWSVIAVTTLLAALTIIDVLLHVLISKLRKKEEPAAGNNATS